MSENVKSQSALLLLILVRDIFQHRVGSPLWVREMRRRGL